MNIKELQLSKAVSEAKQFFLKKGKTPTATEISEATSSKFKESSPGFPLFKPVYGDAYEASDKASFNKMLGAIHSDITDLYDADSYINNEILSLFNYYECEKRNAFGFLNKLQRKLDGILYAMDDKSVKANIYDGFDDFTHIDFMGDKSKNIYETDAYINLLSKYASNDILYATKVNLSNASVAIHTDAKVSSNKQLSDIKNCLTDNASETWVQKIISEQPNNLELRLEIELEREEVINNININLSSPKKLITSVVLTDEAGNTKDLNKIESYDECEWVFKDTTVKRIVFYISKTEPDDADGVNYMYYIGAKNISLCKNTYATKGVLVSSPYVIESPFSQVYLNCDAIIPQSTRIKPFIGIEKPYRSINWIALKDSQINELNLLSTSVEQITPTAAGYGSSFSKELFVLCELAQTPVRKSLKMDVGNGMWDVKEMAYNDSVQLKDIYNQRTSRFVNTDSIKFDIASMSIQMISINVYCEKSLSLQSIVQSPNDIRKYVFVNGMAIQSTRSSITDGNLNIRLAIGWNSISVIAINPTTADSHFIFDAYFKDKALVTVGEINTEEVDIYDMTNSTPPNSYDKYAIVDNKVVVNYDPRKIGLLCRAKYCYDTSNIFDDAQLRFMCVFESDTDQLTPRLYSYQLALLSDASTDTGVGGGTLDGTFTVTYLDYNGAVLKVDYVPEGFASTPPVDPVRYGYTFTGWDKDTSCITGNLITTALYDVSSYTVIFKNWDGTILSTQQITHGNDAVEPPIPDGPTTGGVGVQFFDKDGTEISFTTIVNGGSVKPPTPPVVEGYTFKEWRETTYNGPIDIPGASKVFKRWSEPFTNVTSDLVIYAIFEDEQEIECKFIDYNDALLGLKFVQRGTTVTPPDDPIRPGYEFIGWEVEGQGSIDCTFLDYDGSILKVDSVKYGGVATPPVDPIRKGYEFIGWELSETTVTLKVDSNVYKIINAEIGSTITLPDGPQKNGHVFKMWNQTK